MDEDQALLGAIDAAEANSYGSDNDGELADERAQAIDAYLGRNTEPGPDGRSQVTDRSVYETIQWIMPSLARIFANGDDIVELPPVGQEDEEGAKQEAEFLNHVVLQRNDWFSIFDTAAKDALMNKLGYLHPYREKKRQVEIEQYERQTPESLALLLEDSGAQVIKSKEYPDPDYKPQPMMMANPQTGQPMPVIDADTGQPAMQPPPMLYDVTIRRTKEETKYCVKALPPERCKVAKTNTTVSVVESSYFEYFDYPTLSDLRAMGYEIDDDIASDTDARPEEDIARDQYSENAFASDDQVDPASKRVKCRWIWITHDSDGDGIAERQYVVRIGNKVIHKEEVNLTPIAAISPDPLPHRHVGLCPADTVLEIQRIKTAILRQGLDNLYLSNNPRTFATTNVNIDDLLVSRPGGIVRGKAGAQFGVDIAPIATPFVFPQAMEGMEYMDQVKENRTGTSRYFTGIDQNALNKTATGVQTLSTMAAQRVEQIARYLAPGVTECFLILHGIILKSGHKAEVVKLRNKWVTVNPAEWRRRSDFKPRVAYAAGNKDAMVSRLMMISAKQTEALSLGLPVVQPQNVYATSLELAKAADLTTPERFFTDPASVGPPQPPQPDPTQIALEQMKQQTEAAKLQQSERESQRTAELDKYKVDTDASVKLLLADKQVQNEREIEGIRQSHASDLEDQKAFNQHQLTEVQMEHEGLADEQREEKKMLKLKEFEQLTEQQQQVIQSMNEMRAAVEQMRDLFVSYVNGERRVKRGQDGKAEGIDILTPDGQVLASRSIQRGDDGRVNGSA